jgi:hypothetical protein
VVRSQNTDDYLSSTFVVRQSADLAFLVVDLLQIYMMLNVVNILPRHFIGFHSLQP